MSIVRLPVFNIKLYVILNEFLIKLSSQKITECVALQWSQNQLDHRFTKKNHCWIICREFVADLMSGVRVYGEVIHSGRGGPTGQWIYQSYSSPTLWPPWALWWHSKRTTDNIWEIVNTCTVYANKLLQKLPRDINTCKWIFMNCLKCPCNSVKTVYLAYNSW